MSLDPARVEAVVRAALEEDLGGGDATTRATVPPTLHARGVLLAKQDLVLCGMDVAGAVFRVLDASVSWSPRVGEGERVAAGTVLGEVSGLAPVLLAGERVALNFLQRMTGIATLTRRFVDAVAGTRARIRDTRKTTPLLRFLEKHAVIVGGGTAHRSGLSGGILVKDNHVRLGGGVAEVTRLALAAAGELPVEIEVERLEQIEVALAAGAWMLLLDNFTPEQVRQAVALVGGRVPLEVSGGVRLDNVRAYAEAGADLIAVGALTHSAPAADISLELEAA
jgi:nicotinate-nucleotide pyrophosphorylase (carboxylating)